MEPTQEQQIDGVKAFIHDYGWSIFFIIALLFLASFGWQFWKRYQVKQLEQASFLFQSLINESSLPSNKHQQANQKQWMNKLLNDYPSSPYTVFVYLKQSQMMTESGNFKKAKKMLDQAIKHTKSIELKAIIHLRQVKLLIQMHDFDQAKKILNRVQAPSFQAEVNQLKKVIDLQRALPIKTLAA